MPFFFHQLAYRSESTPEVHAIMLKTRVLVNCCAFRDFFVLKIRGLGFLTQKPSKIDPPNGISRLKRKNLYISRTAIDRNKISKTGNRKSMVADQTHMFVLPQPCHVTLFSVTWRILRYINHESSIKWQYRFWSHVVMWPSFRTFTRFPQQKTLDIQVQSMKRIQMEA